MILTIRTYVASKISLDEIVLYCVLKFPIFFLHNGQSFGIKNKTIIKKKNRKRKKNTRTKRINGNAIACSNSIIHRQHNKKSRAKTNVKKMVGNGRIFIECCNRYCSMNREKSAHGHC